MTNLCFVCSIMLAENDRTERSIWWFSNQYKLCGVIHSISWYVWIHAGKTEEFRAWETWSVNIPHTIVDKHIVTIYIVIKSQFIVSVVLVNVGHIWDLVGLHQFLLTMTVSCTLRLKFWSTSLNEPNVLHWLIHSVYLSAIIIFGHLSCLRGNPACLRET